MFSSLLVAPEGLAAQAIAQLCVESGEVRLYKTVHAAPSAFELGNLVASFSPDIVFLECSDFSSVAPITSLCREMAPRCAIIAYNPNTLSFPVNSLNGVHAFLPPRPTLETFREAVRQAIHAVRPARMNNLIIFLPGKAGSGSTTTALNVAGVLAAEGERVLIVEADLHSGVLSVLLQLEPSGSIQAALQNAAELDYSRWNAAVTQAQGLDLLVRKGPRGPLPSWSQYYRLLEYASSQYDHIIVDLPEVTNDATFEAVRMARLVLVVCTPELPSLALAKQRCAELRERGLAADQLAVVLNRHHRSDPSVSEVEDFVGQRVAAVLPNDYHTIHKAILDSTLVSSQGKLGRAYARFAHWLKEPTRKSVADQDSSLISLLRARFRTAG